MAYEIRPATHDRFADVALLLGPKNPTSSVCWCLSHRLDSRTNRSLSGPERGRYVEDLTRCAVAPGVLAYVGTRALFEGAGFTLAARTDATSGGLPRVLMRLDLLG